jgi:hypothetical protein
MEVLFIMLVIVIFLFVILKHCVAEGATMRRNMVDAHKRDLRKGGLMPRVHQDIHTQALEEIYYESPNIKLPRRRVMK